MMITPAFAAMVALAASAGPAAAYPNSMPGGHGGKGATSKPADTLKARYGSVTAELKLPADKAAVVQKILDENYKLLMEWVAKVDPEVVKLRQQMRSVHGSPEPKAVEQAQAALNRYRELQAEMGQRVAEVLTPLAKVLTPEQVQQVRGILLPQSGPRRKQPMPDNPFHLLAGLKLTPEQISRISQIMDESRTAGKDKAGKDKPSEAASIESKAWQRIIKEVLTADQQKQLAERRTEATHRRMALAMLGGLELAPEQMDRVDAIWKQAYNEAVKKPAERMEIYSKAADKIVTDVLTDQQRKQLNENRKGAPHPMPAS
jgi:Spy/CpxP family protein refolding chaperone